VDDESVLEREAAEPDLVVSWGPGPDDVADVRLGSDDRPLLVMLHGGFWRPAYDRLHVRPMTEALAAAGYTVVAPEYRRVPGNPDATCGDVRVALRVLPVELRGRYDGRVIVLGHSAGGHLALWAASAAPAAKLVGTVALAPVADLVTAEREHLGDGAVRAFLGGPASGRSDLDPTRLVSASTPVAIVHGLEDSTVPATQSDAYVATHRRTTLHEVPAAGHLALIDPTSAAWDVVLRAVTAMAPAGS
jgi:acetyl esterase/lipase